MIQNDVELKCTLRACRIIDTGNTAFMLLYSSLVMRIF